MRKLFFLLIVACAGFFPSSSQALVSNAEMQLLKARQKAERRALKQGHAITRKSLKGQPVPKAARLQQKHQMQREQRTLRERQKDEMQDLKDRQKMLKESQRRM